MPKNDAAQKADAPQIQRFREAARELGADESEAAFKERLAVIARQKPKDEPKPAPARPKKRKAG